MYHMRTAFERHTPTPQTFHNMSQTSSRTSSTSAMPMMDQAHTPCLHDHTVTATEDGLVWKSTTSAGHSWKYSPEGTDGDNVLQMKHQPLFALKDGLLVLRYRVDAIRGLTDLSLMFLGNPDAVNPAQVIPLASVIHKEDLSSKVRDVTVTSAALSPSKRRLACCVQLLLEESFLCEVYTSTIFIYDLEQHSVVLRIQPSSLVWPSVCFLDDRQLALAAVLDADSGFSVTILDVKSGHHVTWCNMEDAVDLSGDSFCQLALSPDGASCTLSILENILHNRDLLCRSYALDAKTVQVKERYRPRLLSPCHWECIFSGLPRFSRCSTKFTLAFVGKSRGTGTRKAQNTFQLPKVLNLKHMARAAIWQIVPEGNVWDGLRLKTGLEEYMKFQ